MNFGTPSEQDEHRLDDALANLFVEDYDERRWLTKAWREQLSPERQKGCLGGLISGDPHAPDEALKGLRKLAGPMPDSFRQPEEQIPF